MLKNAYLHSVIGQTALYPWYSEFKAGRMDVEDLLRKSRPATMRTNEDIARVVAVLKEDHYLSCQSFLEQIGAPKTIVWQILCNCGEIRIFFSCMTMSFHITWQKSSIFGPKRCHSSRPFAITAGYESPLTTACSPNSNWRWRGTTTPR